MLRKIILAALLLCAPSVWAQGTISAMTAASALSGTELFECVQSGSKKCTAAQIKTFTSASPTLVTPVLGVASATSVNKVAITAPATSATLTVADGKTLTASNTLTLSGTDGSTLAVGTGGTLGSAAYTAATAYEVPLTFSTGLSRVGNTITATGGSVAVGDITGLGTGVATALAVNVGSAGAFTTTGANTFTALQQMNVADTVVGIAFGGTTASYPGLRRNGAALEAVKADLSAWVTFKADIVNGQTRLTQSGAGLQDSSTSGYWAMMTNTASAYTGSYANTYRLTATSALTSTVALGYNSSGVAEINSTVAGTYRDLTLRDINAQHIIGRGTAPTVAGSCGTSPTIAGSDSGMKVTTGTGSPTSCTVTFGTAYGTAPSCVANAATTTTALNVATTTTTVIVSAAALTASEVLHVVCIGF